MTRVLVTGWPSFLDGVATIGDVVSLERVATALRNEQVDYDVAWSPAFRSDGVDLETVDPHRYSHVVFTCGPCHGRQIRRLHEQFSHCRRIAVGVSVIDWSDPAVTGFDRVLARDGDARHPNPDLAVQSSPDAAVAVVAVIYAEDQPEYGDRCRQDQVHAGLDEWLAEVGCARLNLDTRLDAHSPHHCARPAQFDSLLARADWAVTTRLHGLVRSLACGVPVLAVDPISGGGKVSAQARALGWPAVVTADELADSSAPLEKWHAWCATEEARRIARQSAADGSVTVETALADVVGWLSFPR